MKIANIVSQWPPSPPWATVLCVYMHIYVSMSCVVFSYLCMGLLN